MVASGGIISDATVSGGGTLALSGVNGSITIAGSNAVRIDRTTMPANAIGGPAHGGAIDLAGGGFSAGGMTGVAVGNASQVVAGGQAGSLQSGPSANPSGDSLQPSAVGSGGKNVSLSQGFTINVTYDSSVTDSGNAAAIEGAVAAAVQFLESTFTNPITLNIDVGYGEINGGPISSGALAESENNTISAGYATITSAMSAGAISTDQIAAAASLPAGNPTNGGSFEIARAEAKALGLLAGTDHSVVDGYVGLSNSASFTFDPNNRAVSGEVDAIGAFEHEITEVMGRVGALGQHDGTNVYTPIDLFRYASAGVRQLVYGPGYFSIDGQTLLTPYNDPSSGGDAVDWYPALVGDSFGDGYSGVASLAGATDLEEMNVLGYDVAFAGTVSSGVTFTVSAGQTDTGLIVLSGGTVNVLSGGVIINALDRGGTVNVSSGAAASGTAVFNGGSQNLFSGGTAITTAIDNGGVQLVAGGVASETAINIGGTMVLSTGATHASLTDGTFVFAGSHSVPAIAGSGAVVASGGTLTLSLTASGNAFTGDFVIAGGGTLELSSAGAAANVPIDFAGAGAVLRVDGTAMPNDVIGGFASGEAIDLSSVSYSSSGSATLLSGNVLQVVEHGQTFHLNLDPAQDFIGQQFLLSSDGHSGTDIAVTSPVVGNGESLTVSSGQTSNGVVVLSGGQLTVLSGGTANATADSGGTDYVYAGGLASGTVVSSGGFEEIGFYTSGFQILGGTATGATVSDGGFQEVWSSGTASGTTVSSGGAAFIYTGGLAVGAIIDGGDLIVSSGGAASGTKLDDGSEFVYSGAVTSGTVVGSNGIEELGFFASGVEDLGGTAVGTIISSGGTEFVDSGGTASSATVESGGSTFVLAGGSAIGVTILGGGAVTVSSGGTLELLGGNTMSGVTVEAGGTLEIGPGNTLSGYVVTSGVSLVIASGGTAVNTTVASGGVASVLSGGADRGTTVRGSGAEEFAFSGGVASGTTVSSGGLQQVGFVASGSTDLGGTAVGTIVSSGGVQNVWSSGVASATIVTGSGAQMDVLAGGLAIGAAVDSGAQLHISSGTTSGTRVNSGSEFVLSGGVASGTIVSSGSFQEVGYFNSSFQFIGGTAVGTIVSSGGIQNVWSSGEASRTVISSGGSEFIFAGGLASGAAVDGGGLVVSSGGTAKGTTVSSGGTESIFTSGIASGTVVGSGGNESVGVYTSGFQLLGGTTIGTTVSSGGFEKVWSGGTASGTVISSGGSEFIFAGGLASGAAVDGGGLVVSSGGTAGGTTVSSGGAESIFTSGIASGTVVGSGGNESVGVYTSGFQLLGGTTIGTTVSSGGFEKVWSGGTASGTVVSSGGTVDVFDGGTLAGSVANDGTVNYDITGSATFSGALTGAGTLVVSGGGHLDVVSAYAGTAQIDDASTLEFTSTYVGVATFSGAPTGPGGTLKFDVPSTGPINVVNPNDTVIAQPGGNNWINAAVSYTLPANIDALFLYAGAQGTGNSDASGDALYALDAGNAQTLTGNSPNDTFVVYNSSDVVVPKAGSHDVVYAAASYMLPTGVDTLILQAGASQGVGNSDVAGDGLYAANPGQVATLTGNSPNDTFVVYNSADVVVPKAGSQDVVYSAVSYTLPTGVDVLILEASATQGVGNGDAAGDTLYAANPSQVATLVGNSANDTFVVYNSADVVVPKAGSHDLVYSAVNYTLPTGVDSLILGPAPRPSATATSPATRSMRRMRGLPRPSPATVTTTLSWSTTPATRWLGRPAAPTWSMRLPTSRCPPTWTRCSSRALRPTAPATAMPATRCTAMPALPAPWWPAAAPTRSTSPAPPAPS